MWEEIITTYLVPAIITLIGGFFAWVGTKIKNLIEEKVKNEEVKDIIENVVMYTEQKCSELTSSEKFDTALAKASEWLESKDITVSEAQLEMLIEAAVNNFYGKEN